VQEVLLRLVGVDERHAFGRQWPTALQLDVEQAFQGVDACSRPSPIFIAVPIELGPHGLGHSPPVGETVLGEHRPRGDEPEVLREVLPQEPGRHRVEEEGPLTGEVDDAPVMVHVQEFVQSQVICAHRTSSIGLIVS